MTLDTLKQPTIRRSGEDEYTQHVEPASVTGNLRLSSIVLIPLKISRTNFGLIEINTSLNIAPKNITGRVTLHDRMARHFLRMNPIDKVINYNADASGINAHVHSFRVDDTGNIFGPRRTNGCEGEHEQCINMLQLP